ncbi:MAG: hypothetical protein WC683_10295 [bacterium]|jgi:hypothetical protein
MDALTYLAHLLLIIYVASATLIWFTDLARYWDKRWDDDGKTPMLANHIITVIAVTVVALASPLIAVIDLCVKGYTTFTRAGDHDQRTRGR